MGPVTTGGSKRQFSACHLYMAALSGPPVTGHRGGRCDSSVLQLWEVCRLLRVRTPGFPGERHSRLGGRLRLVVTT